MPVRILTLAIIGFWIVMTGMLMQSLWFPADSRLTKIDPGAVFQMVAARGEPSTLDVYDDRRIVGHLTVGTTRLRQDQWHPLKLRLNGKIRMDHPLLTGVNVLELESWAELDHGGQVRAFEVRLATGKNGIVLTVSQSAPEVPPVLLLKRDTTVLLDSRTLTDDPGASNPLVTLLLGTFGISLEDLSVIRQQAENQASGMAVEARQGKFDLGGTARQGFILKFGRPGQPGFRLCVENTGEIVRLETPTSYQLLTDSLRPPPVVP